MVSTKLINKNKNIIQNNTKKTILNRKQYINRTILNRKNGYHNNKKYKTLIGGSAPNIISKKQIQKTLREAKLLKIIKDNEDFYDYKYSVTDNVIYSIIQSLSSDSIKTPNDTIINLFVFEIINWINDSGIFTNPNQKKLREFFKSKSTFLDRILKYFNIIEKNNIDSFFKEISSIKKTMENEEIIKIFIKYIDYILYSISMSKNIKFLIYLYLQKK